uniref:Uncharacterized protein n=1 Tax=Ganoderma boninense TaxID=34458 RepID=A0A5K1K7P6_9APHY|nr:Uncharacterized protein [Ganoderma boninense]
MYAPSNLIHIYIEALNADIEPTGLILNRASTVVADAILVFVTWKFLPISALAAKNVMSLTSVMLRNGILYFIVLTMLNVVQLVLTVAPDGVVFYAWYYTFPMSSVLVSHFLLDLQEAHQKTVKGLATIDDPSDSGASHNAEGSIQFASALGSVGAIVGLAADLNQEGEGDDGGATGGLSEVSETIGRDEGEPSSEPRIEDELEISMEEARIGESEPLAVGARSEGVGS